MSVGVRPSIIAMAMEAFGSNGTVDSRSAWNYSTDRCEICKRDMNFCVTHLVVYIKACVCHPYKEREDVQDENRLPS